MKKTKEELLSLADGLVDNVYTNLLILKNGTNLRLASASCSFIDCISSSRRLANRKSSEYFDAKLYYDYVITASAWLASPEVEYADK